MKYSFKSLSVAAGAAALAFAASTASAAQVEVKVSTAGFSGVDYSANGGASYTGTSAGQFTLNVQNRTGSSVLDSVNPILSFCVELSEHVSNGGTYVYNIIENYTNTWSDVVKRLYLDNMAALSSNAGKTAMQLAVWELTQDSSAGSLTSGDFRAKNNANIATAQTWVQNALTSTTDVSGWQIVRLTQENVQDQITFARISEVPLPGAALMFLSALGVGGLARRKKQQAAEGALAAA